MKALLSQLVKLSVSAFIIFWLIQSEQLNLSVIWQISSVGSLSALFALIGLNLLTAFYRWYLLLGAAGIPTSFSETTRLSLVGIFFNYTMLGGVGGDLVKGYYLIGKNPKSARTAALSILADRLIGLTAMIFLATFAGLLNLKIIWANNSTKLLFLATMGLFIGVIAAALLIRSNALINLARRFSFSEKIQDLVIAMQFYFKHPIVLSLGVGLSLISHFCTVVFFMVVASKMGITDIPWSAYLFVVPLGMMASVIPITPAGIGVGQAAYLFLFHLYLQRPVTIGADAVTLVQIILLCYGLIGAFIYLTGMVSTKIPLAKKEENTGETCHEQY